MFAVWLTWSRLDNVILVLVNPHPTDKFKENQLRYPIDSGLSSKKRYSFFEQLGQYEKKQLRTRICCLKTLSHFKIYAFFCCIILLLLDHFRGNFNLWQLPWCPAL